MGRRREGNKWWGESNWVRVWGAASRAALRWQGAAVRRPRCRRERAAYKVAYLPAAGALALQEVALLLGEAGLLVSGHKPEKGSGRERRES